MKTFQGRGKGFTIVELLVVIAVIGILAGIGIVSYSGSQNRAKKANYSATVQQVKLKLGEHFTDTNRYPVNKAAVITYLGGTTTDIGEEFNKSDYTYAVTNTTGGSCGSVPATCVRYTISVPASLWNSTDSISETQ
ncbi:hypothetical protein A2707_02510 [Candidatus Saccharibacteria bacterium RIFCSPHIGHO2_01_FULL_45_15]|nr:MAG: hypothetical protein A2707_02510 [Candidatus Saccharibacteria bacterium RIFCSPHIGHO2_01_FULL_45_15]OGL28768.1 MAG: hypothetical protein A3C39_00345 [Candidatus Saccharibacteria bacterium RIFCSPHIGHO2_02_FULL_46_12]OGL31802.1 MAG: hypothetical protein A3E76_03105 [Candidatus Saccharibacteria bacterium RIFCSPHIGHO2_12_FULL_44_22]